MELPNHGQFGVETVSADITLGLIKKDDASIDEEQQVASKTQEDPRRKLLTLGDRKTIQSSS